MEKSHLDRIILLQFIVWFGLPVLVSAVVSAAVMGYFFQMYSAQVNAYIGAAELSAQVGAVTAVLAGLLFCYFVSTWRMCSGISGGKPKNLIKI